MSVTEKIGLSTLTVAYTGKVYSVEERAKRPYYTVTITTPQWQYVDNTLSGGCDEKADERKAFGSLLSFLTACAEAHSYGYEESQDLFPKHVAEWADSRAYELQALMCEYEEIDA